MRQLLARSVTGLSFLLALMVFSSTPASAQDGGLRGGMSVDPDQFFFGGHLETSPLIDRLHFRPNLEVGIGDNLTLLAGNLEFAYKFPRRGDWGIYVGGGPALNVYMVDDLDTNTDAGLNVLIGVEQARGLFFEFKVGAIDSPEFKFGVGWTFR